MKQKIGKIFASSVIIILLSIVGIDFIDYKLHNIKDDSTKNVEVYLSDIKNQDGNILLQDYLEFQCEGFYIIGPYMLTKQRQEIVGVKWYNESTYIRHIINELIFSGDNINENQQILVFVHEGKPMGIAITERENGDLLDYDNPYCKIDEVLYNFNENDGINYWRVKRAQ